MNTRCMPGFHAWNGYKFSQCGLEKPTIEWVYIPGGTFTMGSPTGEVSREADETQHQITVSAFKMSKYTITVAKFKAFVDAKG